jgi:hypothetical protein
MANTLVKACVEQMLARRHSGDHRPRRELLDEVLRLLSPADQERSLRQQVAIEWNRRARKECLEVKSRADEVTRPLPFDTPELSYRTGSLVLVRRDGEEDALRPEFVTGAEVETHDRRETLSNRRRLAYSKDKQRHNKAVTVKLKRHGLHPTQRIIGDMKAEVDQTVCALCGGGYIAGDPWEVDHETPIATDAGVSVMARVHRSCNRSKGKTPVDHLPLQDR